MIQISSPKVTVVEELLNNEIEGIKFETVKKAGLTITCSHNAADDNVAKAAVKTALANTPALKNAFNSVRIVDETGRII